MNASHVLTRYGPPPKPRNSTVVLFGRNFTWRDAKTLKQRLYAIQMRGVCQRHDALFLIRDEFYKHGFASALQRMGRQELSVRIAPVTVALLFRSRLCPVPTDLAGPDRTRFSDAIRLDLRPSG